MRDTLKSVCLITIGGEKLILKYIIYKYIIKKITKSNRNKKKHKKCIGSAGRNAIE